jgi:hypothetical protein
MEFLLQEQSDLFRQTDEMPDWVGPRLREGKKTSGKAEKIQQRNKSRDQRIESMQAGAGYLRDWLLDLMRLGVAAAHGQEPDFWQSMAARMVDAKMGAVGKRIEQLPLLFQQADWPEKLLQELGDLYRLTKSWEQLEWLSSPEQWDLFQASGWNLRKEEVRERNARTGSWRVWHVAFQEDEQLRTRKVWLQEEETGEFALILDFVWGEKTTFEGEWTPGALVLATLSFYPSAYPLRAVMQTQNHKKGTVAYREIRPRGGYDRIGKLRDAFADALAVQPWLRELPVLLREGLLRQESGQWWWQDSSGDQIWLEVASETGWQLTALRASGPLLIFGICQGETFQPLTALCNGRLVFF